MAMVARDSSWDLMVSDRHHRLVLGVEVKGQLGKSPEWAAALRRNMLAHEIYVLTPYFLIVFPDYIHLWTKADQPESSADPWYRLPDYTIPTEPLWQNYLRYLDGDITQLSKSGLEFIVTTWLRVILTTADRSELEAASVNWVVTSGLFDAIAGGRLLVEEMV
jgi:hypothetical protein